MIPAWSLQYFTPQQIESTSPCCLIGNKLVQNPPGPPTSTALLTSRATSASPTSTTLTASFAPAASAAPLASAAHFGQLLCVDLAIPIPIKECEGLL